MSLAEPSGKSADPIRSASRAESFRFALAGWWHLLRTQPNARIHLVITCVVIILGLWLSLDTAGWAVLWLAIGLVFVAELVNSAIESVVDLTSPDIHPLARAAKDMGAGAVLVSACVAAVVGLLTLGPPLIDRLID